MSASKLKSKPRTPAQYRYITVHISQPEIGAADSRALSPPTHTTSAAGSVTLPPLANLGSGCLGFLYAKTCRPGQRVACSSKPSTGAVRSLALRPPVVGAANGWVPFSPTFLVSAVGSMALLPLATWCGG